MSQDSKPCAPEEPALAPSTVATPAHSTTLLLLNHVEQGEPGAFERLDRRYRAALTSWLHGRIPSALRARFDTEDVLQSALARCYQGLAGFQHRGKGSLKAYLRTIVRNSLESKRRRHEAEIRDARRECGSEDQLAGGLNGLGADRMDRTVDSNAGLWAAVMELPPIQAELVRRCAAGGEPVAPVARELGIPERTARTRLTQGLAKLERTLGPAWSYTGSDAS